MGITAVTVGVMLVTASLLFFTKIPAPLIVVTALLAGVVIPPL
ncbi:MAG: hypothetical protein WD492_16735 [Alkalispirochaeta sp.]